MIELLGLELGFKGRVLAGPLHWRMDPAGGVLLRGVSGSGKSTLLRVLAGLARPRGGSFTWRGQDPGQELARHRQCTHLVDQHPLLMGASVREVLLLGLQLRRLPLPSDDHLRDELRRLGLDLDLEGDPLRLSGGEAQRVALLRGLLLPVDLLLLDEPSAGLDQEAALLVRSRLSGPSGPAFVVASHDEGWESCCATHLHLRDGALHAA